MKQVRSALLMLLVLTVLTGVVYPLAVTGDRAGRSSPRRRTAASSSRDGKLVGSALIGQPFDDPRYFWSRPSATSPTGYNGAASSGSNLGPLNPALGGRGQGDASTRCARPIPSTGRPVPVDLVTASGSGLDPHVSPAGARYQVARVARRARPRSGGRARLVDEHTEGRQLGILGEPRVNVLELNLALDAHVTGDRCASRRDAAVARGAPRARRSAPSARGCTIFVGAAPGVGKTYAMLEAARERRREGVDVVVGVVETHGRAETEALLDGLEVVPRRRIEYRGQALHEMDLDAILARRPELVLVDELAHTNAPGSRHPKRYSDVEELLEAGIDVYSTVNIQHLESLNDVVAQITGVRVRETVPDVILERADEIKLDRPVARGPDPAPAGGQGLRPRAGAARDRELLQARQPDRAARAGAAPHRRARRRRDAALHAGARDRRPVGGARAHHGVRERGAVRRAPGARGAAHGGRAARRVDRGLRRAAGLPPPSGGGARARRARAAARRAARRRGGHDPGPRRRGRAGALRARAQRHRDHPRQAAALVLAGARGAARRSTR